VARRQPLLTSTHCVVHRLGLAAYQAGEDVRYISNTFKPTLQQLFYFHENSADGLRAIEQLLQTKELKLKKSADTCWLSVDNACQTLVTVISSLESEAEERGQASAHGLCKVVKQFKFVTTLYMMCDVLPVVSHLSRIFQYPDINLSVLQKLESTTTKELKILREHSGAQLKTDLKSSQSAFNISYNAESVNTFHKHTYT